MRDDAARHLQTALALAGQNQEVLENVAEGFEHLGRRREAVQYLEQAVAKGYPMEDLRTNPAVASLLADPSFRAK
jgi:Flp pilus assembly protein TadD